MNINRHTTFRVILPAVGIGITGIAFASVVTSTPAPTTYSIVSTDEQAVNAIEDSLSEPKVSVSVNGAPVKLITQGQATITAPSVTSVHVSTKTPQTEFKTNSAPTSVGIEYHVESSNASSTSPTGNDSSNVQVYGSSSTFSSSYSSTSVFGNQSNVEVNSSN